MSDGSFMVGFVIGVAFSALVNVFFFREEVSHINVEAITSTIQKCPNGEYHSIEVRGGRGTYRHEETDIYCLDGSFVSTRITE